MVGLPELQVWLRVCLDHIAAMNAERAGYGPVVTLAVERTEASLLQAVVTLLGANEVWLVKDAMGIEGFMPGGVLFGMVAREKEESVFLLPEIEWTFHS